MNETPQQPAAPIPGSHRYLVWLYTPPAMRAELNTIVALADEIGVPPAGLDHSVTHVRLEWWRQEAERFALKQPQHPWLKSLLAHDPSASRLDLRSLVQAAATDLAWQTLRAEAGLMLRTALFLVIADALCGQALTPAQQQALGELGAATQQFESAHRELTQSKSTSGAPVSERMSVPPRDDLKTQVQRLGSGLQRPLTPLLLWLALAARGSHARSAWLASLSDNLLAWNSARRCARGRFMLN